MKPKKNYTLDENIMPKPIKFQLIMLTLNGKGLCLLDVKLYLKWICCQLLCSDGSSGALHCGVLHDNLVFSLIVVSIVLLNLCAWSLWCPMVKNWRDIYPRNKFFCSFSMLLQSNLKCRHKVRHWNLLTVFGYKELLTWSRVSSF